ncbi:hypothetical protein SRHO_G00341070 [Serrasalmus rhombeus]
MDLDSHKPSLTTSGNTALCHFFPGNLDSGPFFLISFDCPCVQLLGVLTHLDTRWRVWPTSKGQLTRL